MESTALTIESNSEWRHCHLMCKWGCVLECARHSVYKHRFYHPYVADDDAELHVCVCVCVYVCVCVEQVQHAETEAVVRDRARSRGWSQSQINAAADHFTFWSRATYNFSRVTHDEFSFRQRRTSTFWRRERCTTQFHQFLLVCECRVWQMYDSLLYDI